MKKSMKVFVRAAIVLLAMTVISSYPSAAQMNIDMKGLNKEVKRLRKEGYKPLLGYPSLEEQLAMQQISLYSYDAERVPKYIMGSSRCEFTVCGLESTVQKAINQVVNEIALMVVEEIQEPGVSSSGDIVLYNEIKEKLIPVRGIYNEKEVELGYMVIAKEILTACAESKKNE